MKNKKGLELAISTIILMTLGILVLIGLIAILVMGWSDFKAKIGVILGSDFDKARKDCELQCQLGKIYDYCCGEKIIDDRSYNCLDEVLKVDCDINCAEVSCLKD